MDTIKSFKGYGKVDEAEQRAFQKKVRTRIILISISAIILVAIIIAAVVVSINSHKSKPSSPSQSSLSPAQSLKAVCSVTQYPSTCFSSLSSSITTSSSSPKNLFSLSLHVAMDSVSKLPSLLPQPSHDNALSSKALSNCHDLLDDALDRLNDSLSSHKIDDLRTWLSTALTNQETCLDGLSEINSTSSLATDLRKKMQNSTELVSNSLALVTKVVGVLGKFKIPTIPNHRRKLLGLELPEWVGAAERRLLQDGTAAAKPDAVVAKDGSGDYKTIGEAVNAAPKKSNKRYVIYVKTGVYVENVVMDKHVWNVMMYGDGMDKSVVSGNLNFIDGTPTFSTATFAVDGKGFIAKDMGFKNTAGAEKHQAVAFRSKSDKSILYRCFFDGYQDTLYPHSNHQFYRECTITGTIDFIFGNAAVVFQKCNIQPRQPMANQFNTITAQGKKDPNQNTGISIQKCTISPLGQVTAPTYFGRPWKEFATTVIMQSEIGAVLHPLGWIGWVNGVEPASTIFYGEYQNTGPGADVTKRVKWAGYKPTITANEASKYTVNSLISGNEWLGDSNVVFDATL